MQSGTDRADSRNARIRYAIGKCSLGQLLVASNASGICAIAIGDKPTTLTRELRARFPHASLLADDSSARKLLTRVVRFVESPARGLDLPLDLHGTDFQQRVWRALRKIPVGQTASYTDIAKRIGAPTAARAVAAACAANRLAVAIPCHRVICSDGAISGYRWGMARKKALLDLETRSLKA